MQAAADQKPSAMVSVIGLSSEKVFALLHNRENDWAHLCWHKQIHAWRNILS